MCKIMEELKREGFAEGKAETLFEIAKNMKVSGKFSDEAIVLATKLTLAQVKAIRV